MRNAVSALIRKDLLLQRRTPEAVPAMVLFSIGTFVLFHFALDEREVSGTLASGILWVTLLFAAVLGINRLFVSEREEGGFDGFLLAPVDRTSMLVAKTTVLFLFLCAVEVFVLAAFAILLLGPSLRLELVVVLLLANAGIAVIGTPAERSAGDRRGARHRAIAHRGRRRGARRALAGRPRPL